MAQYGYVLEIILAGVSYSGKQSLPVDNFIFDSIVFQCNQRWYYQQKNLLLNRSVMKSGMPLLLTLLHLEKKLLKYWLVTHVTIPECSVDFKYSDENCIKIRNIYQLK